MNDRESCFRPSIDEKLLFRERILESDKFVVGLSHQLLIISNNICHSTTELAVMPDLRGCSSPHSPSLDTPLFYKTLYKVYFEVIGALSRYWHGWNNYSTKPVLTGVISGHEPSEELEQQLISSLDSFL